ncbi:hypothetical protein ONS95_010913 [Cadophora gregata]|uniref:uncharacterized protein n=1 Tax=Cadophora gregata TaxID=51156 RepID=UPI0026DA8FFF|nr:uncharacterized protein ONS95_010913 [Cadophora gregata]KAK0119465.1 hypothetical protein ONS95_010913 [Cadophora gregata]
MEEKLPSTPPSQEESLPPMTEVDEQPIATEEKNGSFKDFIRIFQYADRTSWILNVISFITSIGAGITLPWMTLVFGDSVGEFNNFSAADIDPQSFRNTILNSVKLFVYLFVAKLLLSYISTITICISAIRTTRDLRQDFLSHTLRKETWHFDLQNASSVAVLVTTNGSRINKGVADKLAFLVQYLAMFFAAFIVALAVQWKLALITMSVIPAIFVITFGVIALDAPVEARIMKIYSKGGFAAQEAISTIRTVHAFWAQSKLIAKYDKYLKDAHTEGKKKSIFYGVLFSTEYFCVYSGIALAFWKGYRMYRSGEIESVGTVFTVVFSVLIASSTISAIAPQFQTFTNAAAAASELFELIDSPSLLDPLSDDGIKPDKCEGHLEVRDLKFSYPSRPGIQVLNGLNISIPAGKTTALVGASGCGKSTLIGLLERWYERKSGEILLDGKDITSINTRWLRSQIGLVQQEPVLFQGTIFQNVANGFLDHQKLLPREEQLRLIQQACETSNSHEFISELPEGYDTEIGEAAGLLSGGQKQRVAIARSIISNPKILLLDEATSALDPRAEGIVQAALDKVSADRTTLVIAHKLATIKNADNIAVISYGRVVEQGTHDELLKAGGHYARLVAAQDISGENEDSDKESTANEEQADNGLAQQTSLYKTQTQASAAAMEDGSGTVGYSLLKCIWIMFGEQRALYPHFVITVLCALAAGATFPGQAILFSRILNVFTLPPNEAQSEANFYALMFFIIALGNLVAYFIIGVLCNVIGQAVTYRYRKEMFTDMLKQDMEFFNLPGNTSGALTSKLSSLPTQLQDLLSANILLIFIVFVNVISSSILAIAYGWKLGLVMVFAGLPPLLVSGYIRIRLETALEKENSERFAESASLASEAVLAIKTVSSLTLETAILERYNEKLSSIVKVSIKSLTSTIAFYAISQSLDFLVMALGFWYGSQLLLKGEYTITEFYVIFIGVLFAGQAAAQFFSYTTSITQASGAANYILWLRARKPVMQETPDNIDKGPGGDGGEIALSSMGFQYPGRTTRVLKDINMTIKHGEFAAFVGPSGCGKSTMVNLLERFYDPTTGEISFAGKPIQTYSPRLYRQNISLVQQEPTLYSGSVFENVSLGLEEAATEAQIVEACRQANALEFIESLPEGFQTACGNRGLQFSGGQKQRIAIARALIRKPRLLLLDEATSALDTQSERIVQDALDQAKEGRTTIAVAHRLSTIKHADIIFVFGDGRVVESGTHSELLAMKGRYYDMCLAQSLDKQV